jgi:hypothetical protein
LPARASARLDAAARIGENDRVSTDEPAPDPDLRSQRRAGQCMRISLGLGLTNVVLWLIMLGDDTGASLLFITLLALAQLVTAIVGMAAGLRLLRDTPPAQPRPSGALPAVIVGVLTILAAPVMWFFGVALMALSGGGGLGGAWGRPLRIRGRQRHPSLRAGSDWTAGARPSAAGLDPATRGALEALWLHDAQKEHASVPAFARISWLLAAVGAPAELLAWSHRAALEEIDHTRRCFALAAGYAGRSHSVEPMPELLLGGLDLRGDPRAVLAAESLSDGCQLEDFNADVAAECARVCQEPVTRAVLEQIAREERSHAEFSWALLEWLLRRDRPHVEAALTTALAALADYPRPTAVSAERRGLVAAADPALLLAHGRLPDARWGEIWDDRLLRTTARTQALLAAPTARAA